MYLTQQQYSGFVKAKFRYVIGMTTGIVVSGWSKKENALSDDARETDFLEGTLKGMAFEQVVEHHQINKEDKDRLVRVSLLETTYDPHSKLGKKELAVSCDEYH